MTHPASPNQQEYLERALESAGVGIWSLNVQTNRGEVDARAVHILGYRSEEIPRDLAGWNRLIHPDDLPGINAALEGLLTGQAASFESEHRVLHASGEYIWVNGRARITQTGSDGAPLVISGTIMEVNARKQAELILSESEEQFRLFVEHSVDGIAIFDENGRVIEWNSAQEKITGITCAEVMGVYFSDIISRLALYPPLPHQISQQNKQVAAALRTGQAPFLNRFIEAAFVHSEDREVRHAQQIAFTFKTARGYKLGLLSRDITGQKTTETALKESEVRHRLLFENMARGVTYQDAQGRILAANPAALKILGIPLEDLIGSGNFHPNWPLYREDSSPLPEEEHPISLALRDKRPVVDVIIRLDNPVKKIRQTLSVSGIPMFHPGQDNPYQVYCIFEDITHKRHLEESLRQSEQKFETMFAVLREGIVLQNRDGEITLCNPAAEHILGLSQEQMLGRKSIDLRWRAIHENGAPFPGTEHPAMLTLRTGQPCRDAVMGLYKPSGELIWILINTQPLTTPGEDSPYAVVSTFSDFTQRKQAETALRESEARFKNLADTVPALVWMSGTDSLCTYFNKPWLDFTGRSLDLEIGSGWAEGVHPDDLQICLNIYHSSFKSRIQFEMEYRLRRYDGEYRWLLNHGMPRFTVEGLFMGYIGSCIDITERKQMEFRLAENESNLKAIFDASDDAIFLIAADNTLLALNTEAANRFNLPAEEMVGKNTTGFLLLPPEAASDRIVKMEQVFAAGQPVSFVDQRAGRWLSNHIRPILGASGKVDRLVVFSRDITDQKLADEKVRASEDRLAKILAASPVGISLVRMCDQNFIEINPEFETITGYTSAELIGRTPVNFTLWLNHAERDRYVGMLKKDGKVRSFEMELLTKGGEVKQILLSAEILQIENEPHIVTIVQDISERKRMEIALQEQRDFANQIINLMGQGLTVTDRDGKFTFSNPAYAEMIGYTPAELSGKGPLDVTLPEDLEALLVQRAERLAGRPGRYESRLVHASGETLPVLVSGVPRAPGPDGVSPGTIAVITDLRQQKHNEQELRDAKQALEAALMREQELARIDSLTGIYNRRYLLEMAEDRLTTARRHLLPLSILLFDFDHYKQVNDTFGHLAGDEVLRVIIQTIKKELRSTDVFGRYGGEEFVIVLPMTAVPQALESAERVRLAAAAVTVETEKGPVSATISIGIAEFNHADPAEKLETMLARADAAMYQAKDAGRNCVKIYTPPENFTKI